MMDEAKVLEVLRQVEWAKADGAEEFCPCCEWNKEDGHADDCKLDGLLRYMVGYTLRVKGIAVKAHIADSAAIADGVRGPSITAGAVMTASLLAVFNLLGIPEGGRLEVWDTIDPDQRFVIRRIRRTQGKAGEDDGGQ